MVIAVSPQHGSSFGRFAEEPHYTFTNLLLHKVTKLYEIWTAITIGQGMAQDRQFRTQ